MQWLITKILFIFALLQCAHTFSGLTMKKRRVDIPSLFQNDNVHTIHMPITPSSSLIWETLVPPPQNKVIQLQHLTWLKSLLTRKTSHHTGLVVDKSVQFSDPLVGSQLLVDELYHIGCHLTLREKDYLVNVFTRFENIVASSSLLKDHSITLPNDFRFKARIVSSRGPVGQKCPRWHVDHVPIRLVLSLVGPGSVYIPLHREQTWMSEHGKVLINRDALNNLDEEDSKKANEIILPFGEENMTVQAKSGEAVFMMGKAWEDGDNEENCQLPDGAITALVHKSPTLQADEARVLLTVDVLGSSI